MFPSHDQGGYGTLNKRLVAVAIELMDGVVVSNSGCWVWQKGLVETSGYASITRSYKKNVQEGGHRLAYAVFNGVDIPDGLYVCHTCDNKACINPDHLWLGTQKDNIRDMMKKGRRVWAKGEQVANSKLTDETIRAIRKSDEQVKKIAEKYGISSGHVSNIKSGLLWGHVK